MTDQVSHDETAGPRQSRALVPVAPSRDATGRVISALPGFLAQLIACHRRLPDYRRSRREEPGPATAAYDRTSGRAAPGLDLSV